jgi:serine/threonine protein kinase
MQNSVSSGGVPEAGDVGAFGKYNLIASLGQGGMANVFLALMAGPSGFNKLLVIKIMRQDMLAGSEESVRMFFAEARLAARLVHPNIVHTYEVGEHEGRHFIAMEYLDGQPLSTVLNRARNEHEIPLAEHLRMIAELARGLHYAHGLLDFQGEPLNVVHRDVSPQNVIVTYDGQVKLLDFGIAKTADAEHLTQVGMIKGKLDYIAPEQLRSEQVDGRADIFALGAMLWEVISGHRFAGGRRVTDINKMQARLTGGERKLRALRPDVPASLEAIVERAIALDPADRYQDAAELADAIEAHLEEMQLRASARTLAQHMGALFASERAEMHKLIDEQVQRIKRGSLIPDTSSSLAIRKVPTRLGLFVSDTHLDERSSIRNMTQAAMSTPASAPPHHRPLFSVIAALVALAAGGGFVWFMLASGEDVERAERAHAPPLLPAAAPPAPAQEQAGRPASMPLHGGGELRGTVTLRVHAAPAQARVTLDGIPLALPFEGAFQRDGALHRLEATAEGYRPLKQFVAFDQDRELGLQLERVTLRRGAFERVEWGAGVQDAAPHARPVERKTPIMPATPDRPNPYDE